MYSVLIQNKKTMESFHEFHPLFLETLGKDIVLCRWLEAGTTIDTALPELSQLTDSVEKWRAIIVHVEDEEEMRKYERHPDNPYDFLINSSKADATKESPVPLIRLTHMLGGVPAPEIEYESRVVAEKAKVPRTIYVPKPRGEETRLHAELLERYNVAQVQGLLMTAKSLQIRADHADPAELRRLFKYLKFFRLLAEIRQDGPAYIIRISGPLAIFSNTRKYALQLAAFFPAVLLLKKWKLTAEIEWKNRSLQLILDEKSNLRSHDRNFSAYVPEEIAMFHRLLPKIRCGFCGVCSSLPVLIFLPIRKL